MTKDSRGQSTSADQGRSSRKLSCNSNRVKRASSKVAPKDEEDMKEWEEARCPVCMEHPHNAVLLICSSHEKGCRPYMCDTSYRHSNCLDQFRKSCVAPAKETDNVPLQVDHGSLEAIPDLTVIDGAEQESPDASIPSPSNKVQAKLQCPLCRGHIIEWVVRESARRFMNSKSRSCACETCEYSGTYADLRKHARVEHPLVRPSEADPERRRNWRRMERQRDMGDLLSTLRSSFWEDSDEEHDGNGSSPAGDRGWLRAFLVLIRVFRPASGLRSSRSRSGTTTGYTYRTRAHVTIRRRSVMLWEEGFDGDALRSSAIEGESESSNDGTAAP